MLAVRASHTLTLGSGRTLTTAGAVRLIPRGAWQRMRTGHGTKGSRRYDCAMLEVDQRRRARRPPSERDDGRSALLVRDHRYTSTCSFYRRWTPGSVPLARLIATPATRWRVEHEHADDYRVFNPFRDQKNQTLYHRGAARRRCKHAP